MSKCKSISLIILITLISNCSFKKEERKSRSFITAKKTDSINPEIGKKNREIFDERNNDSIVSKNRLDTENIKYSEEKITEVFKNCNETFDSFFKKFAKDSVFQKSKIKYPLNLLYNDYEIDSIIIVKTYYTKNDYKYFDFSNDKNAMKRSYDKYNVEIEKSKNLVKYRHIGYDNGILNTYTFKLISNCWYMVEILDEST
ncbi:DUF4348 domain-containing protein [Tenacibaculum sp. 190524A05c]|uniref:DUF4348 domain-containing protein n=1 Tax=Tenacibaculum platacis TaxID=3137852 RepID=UPI0032B0F592